MPYVWHRSRCCRAMRLTPISSSLSLKAGSERSLRRYRLTRESPRLFMRPMGHNEKALGLRAAGALWLKHDPSYYEEEMRQTFSVGLECCRARTARDRGRRVISRVRHLCMIDVLVVFPDLTIRLLTERELNAVVEMSQQPPSSSCGQFRLVHHEFLFRAVQLDGPVMQLKSVPSSIGYSYHLAVADIALPSTVLIACCLFNGDTDFLSTIHPNLTSETYASYFHDGKTSYGDSSRCVDSANDTHDHVSMISRGARIWSKSYIRRMPMMLSTDTRGIRVIVECIHSCDLRTMRVIIPKGCAFGYRLHLAHQSAAVGRVHWRLWLSSFRSPCPTRCNRKLLFLPSFHQVIPATLEIVHLRNLTIYDL